MVMIRSDRSVADNHGANKRSNVSVGTKHIDSGDHVSVNSKKCHPRLRRWLPTSHHVFGDCRLIGLEPEHQQFAMDSGRST
jgi:hypothetical protein